MKNLQRLLLLLLLSSITNTMVIAQDFKSMYKWGYLSPFNQKDYLTDIVEDSQGNIVGAGVTKRGDRSNTNIWLAVWGENGRIKRENIIGGEGEDIAHALIACYDGGFLIVGSTRSSIAEGYQEKGQNAWIIKTDEKGAVIWERASAIHKESAFFDVVQLPDGGYMAVGKTGPDALLQKLDSRGNLEWTSTPFKGVIKSVCTDEDGNVFTTGHNVPDDFDFAPQQMILGHFTSSGRKIFIKNFSDEKRDPLSGMALCMTQNGNVLVTGVVDRPFGTDKDLFFVLASPKGETLHKTYWKGIKGDNVVKDIYPTFEGNFLICGYTFHKSLTRPDAFIHKVDSSGQRLWERSYSPDTKYEEVFESCIQTVNGHLIAAGKSGKGSFKPDHAKLVCLSENNDRANPAPTLQVEPGKVYFTSPQNILEPYSRAYYQLSLTNNDNLPATDISAQVFTNSDCGLHYYSTVKFGNLSPGATKKVAVPVWAAEDIRRGEATFRIQLLQGQKILSKRLTFSVKCAPEPQSHIVISRKRFPTGKAVKRNGVNTLQIGLKNRGELPNEKVQIVFHYPKNVISQKHVQVYHNFMPEEEKKANFSFQLNDVFKGDSLTISCEITGRGGTYLWEDIQLPVSDIAHHTPKEATIEWITHTPLENSLSVEEIKAKQGAYTLKARIYTNFTLRPQHIRFERKSREIRIDRKYFEEDFLLIDSFTLSGPFKDLQDEQTPSYYLLEKEILLKRGTNDFFLSIQPGKIDLVQKQFRITYGKPKLFLIGIGIPKYGLRYPQNDVHDFLSLFNDQFGSDQMFDTIYQITMADPETTRSEVIENKMVTLYDFVKSGEMTERDLLIVFISAHGDIEKNNRYYLIPFNHMEGASEKYKIKLYFDNTILANINILPCKKIVFIDACKSGKAIKNLPTDYPVQILTSCSEEEFSYEDYTWKNGAFTEALIKALSTSKTDINENGLISIQELYNYLKIEVPKLVRKKKEAKGDTQTPFWNKKGEEGYDFYQLF